MINFGSGDLETNLNLEEKEITNVRDIEAVFSIRNNTNETKEYNFSSGCQFAFQVLKDDVIVFDSRENVGCTASFTGFGLRKNESKSFIITASPFDSVLEQNNYLLKAFLIGYENEVFAIQSFKVN